MGSDYMEYFMAYNLNSFILKIISDINVIYYNYYILYIFLICELLLYFLISEALDALQSKALDAYNINYKILNY